MPVPSTSAPAASAPSTRSRRRARVPGPAAPVAPGTGGPAGPGAGARGNAGGEPGAAGAGLGGPADDVVRWAVFCCALVPLVLVAFGTSLGGAGGAALGLASVTAACRLLLRRAERGLRAEGGAAGGTRAGGRRRG
ncbi:MULTISPECIES: hypothetical protein [unclassified Streptomyces]|uniref:hypothetical protein n=1 Tax=unclassified Streptomyces TaxID=2593676 RepID=UPI000A433014|nr:hypothetical protein [Streptomyces sp. NRRL F-5727]